VIATLRHLGRLGRIAATLARHDALEPLMPTGVPAWLRRSVRRFARPGAEARPGRRVARALADLGPAFVKLGQMLSVRPDLVGEAMAEDLADLQDRLAPFPGQAARAAIARDLGQPVEALFATFDDDAIAAASIAQVHWGTTTDGREVAVKVLRPGIEAAFERDLALLAWLARLARRLMPGLARLKPVETIATLAESVRLEMDLRMEAAAASELAENFKGDAGFRVPAVDWARTGRRVLTLERIAGTPIDERDALIAAGHDPRVVLTRAAEALFSQAFGDGFFHADLHPGNLFVDAAGTIVAVDFGIMGRLDWATRRHLADILVGFLTRDYARVAEAHFAAGYVPAGRSAATFRQACRAIGEPILGLAMNEISVARLLGQLFRVTRDFGMETQTQLLLLQKSMVVAEGVGRALDPTVNMWELIRPLIESWAAEHRSPEGRVRDALSEGLAAAARVPRILAEAEAALATLKRAANQAEAPRASALLPWLAILLALALLALGD